MALGGEHHPRVTSWCATTIRVVADTDAPLVLYESGFVLGAGTLPAPTSRRGSHAIDGEKLKAAPGQEVATADGPDPQPQRG